MSSRTSDSTERLTWLYGLLKVRGSLDVSEAWEAGHAAGYYVGGDAPKVKDDLNALAGSNRARRHNGFWRAMTKSERRRAARWADYWTLP